MWQNITRIIRGDLQKQMENNPDLWTKTHLSFFFLTGFASNTSFLNQGCYLFVILISTLAFKFFLTMSITMNKIHNAIKKNMMPCLQILYVRFNHLSVVDQMCYCRGRSKYIYLDQSPTGVWYAPISSDFCLFFLQL